MVGSFLGLRARQGKPSFVPSNGKLRPRLEVRDGFAFEGSDAGEGQSDQPQSRASGLGCELASGMEVDIQCAEGHSRQAGLQGD